MTTQERARAMRAARLGFDEISRNLGISLQYAHKCAGDVTPREPRETPATIIKYHADSDGHPRPVRMPRIPALHGAMAS